MRKKLALIGLGVAFLLGANSIKGLASINYEKSPVKKIEAILEEETYPTSKGLFTTNNFCKDNDQTILARMLLGEAEGCSDMEMIAIAYTAITRTNDGIKRNGETLQEVILKPRQYSCFNLDNPRREILENPLKYNSKEFMRCLRISKNILEGRYENPVPNSDHYFNPRLVDKPNWANKLKKIGRIKVGETEKGSPIWSIHIFYRE